MLITEETLKSLVFKQCYVVLQGCLSRICFLKAYYDYYLMGKKNGTALTAGISLVTLKPCNKVACLGK